jgi:small subunit ribosomal protein S18
MSEETIQTPAQEAGAASNTGGDDRGPKKYARDKEAYGNVPAEGKFRGRRRRKVSYLTINKIDHVDYKEVNILRRFINERGKMIPARQTGNTAKQQRMIARAIRRAREMALLPFVVTEFSHQDRPPRPPRERRYDRYEPREQREPRDSSADSGENEG